MIYVEMECTENLVFELDSDQVFDVNDDHGVIKIPSDDESVGHWLRLQHPEVTLLLKLSMSQISTLKKLLEDCESPKPALNG